MDDKKKNEDLINSMMRECHDRLVAARKQIDARKFNTARSGLYEVTTLLESLKTLDGGSRFDDEKD